MLKKLKLNGMQLKIIAILSMVLDHVGYVLFPEVKVFRILGRIAFPLFCFLIVEGKLHTSDWKKYALRLLIFALISEIPFDLIISGKVLDWSHQNVFWTLLIGLFTMVLYDTKEPLGYLGLGILIVAAGILRVDYGCEGALLLFILYIARKEDLRWCSVITIIWALCYGGMVSAQYWSMLAALFMLKYNKERGYDSKALKYGFYAFYPVHLLVIYVISKLIG